MSLLHCASPLLSRRSAPSCGGRACCRPSTQTFAAPRLLPTCPQRRSNARAVLRGSKTRVVQELLTASAPLAGSAPHQEAEAVEHYPWADQWYPLIPLADLDPSRPKPFNLLGKQLALWCDGNGDWHAMDDRCPHRLAPLSEGRIEDGQLQCSYHGWRFNEAGKCMLVPQISDPKAQAAACASPRSRVPSFPTKVAHGLLWVYGNSTPEAWRAALGDAARPPDSAVPELLEGGGWSQRTQWFFRDLAVRYDSLTENVLDPSHVQFAHHGVQGSRNAPADLDGATPAGINLSGFITRLSKGDGGPQSSYTVAFKAPCTTRYDLGFASLIIYVYPTKVGWSRIGFSMIGRNDVKRKGFKAAVFGWLASQAWLEHALMRHPTFDGDTFMLHQAERVIAQGGTSAVSQYYMPARADASVVAWHKWLKRFGGQVPTCEEGVVLPPALPREVVLDHWAHTQECTGCRTALRNTDVGTAVAAAVAVAAALLLVFRCAWGQPLLQMSSAAVAALALGAAAAAVALRRWRNVYVFTDYVHPDHN